ncbi:MAG TPA: bifunctional 4-hydroxy-2-oxoglutarate aldolase/2-dehydro-3-deoxy-phosphogluconate aldolase [Terriglobia bacterium]|nr:bifunctional 4-hydroxy-2-oxoglutarate aldolase/2-dehydro-3-deoxy-phosphogluconate aldolase [Terriglobia bacterium]
MNKDQVHARISQAGVVPVVRASSAEEARFAAQAVAEGGIPIVEITMTVPGAIEVIRDLVQALPDVVVGAGTVLDSETARRCLDAGAEFLVSPLLDPKTLELAVRENKFTMAGALSPTEVFTAWHEGSDFVKVFPCAQVGGAEYIKALKGPFPGVPLVPTGGVNLKNAADFILAGSAALGVGGELILKEALRTRKPEAIRETARQFVEIVRKARAQMDRGRGE